MTLNKIPLSLKDRLNQTIDADEDRFRTSFAGFEFDFFKSKWALSAEDNLHIKFVKKFPEQFQKGIMETLSYFAENLSAKYTLMHATELRRYIKSSASIDIKGLLAYKLSTPVHNRDQYLSVFRCFCRQMEYLGYEVPKDFMKVFDSWSLGGNQKGIPVLTQDPESGPFSELEFRSIKSNLDYKYAESVISDREYSLAQLFAATFRRPVNLKQLKVKDLIASSTALITKQPIYQINMPRAKGKGRRFRSQFKPFALIQSIGQVLSKHIESARLQLELKIDGKLSLEEAKELPIFFDIDLVASDILSLSNDQLMDYLKSELPHIRRSALTDELRDTINKLGIISERTGQPLKVSAYRFRYTGGTRAAEEGAGLVTIAELLDHSDTQHAGVYVANSPEIGEQISKIMNNPLARYANAFLGKVVTDEQEACIENPNASRIPCRDKNCDVGSCGSNSFCTDYAPVACYLCPKFRPWRDAPHHLVLDWLLKERERVSNSTSDPKVVVINDSAILAVVQVIKLCEEEKSHV